MNRLITDDGAEYEVMRGETPDRTWRLASNPDMRMVFLKEGDHRIPLVVDAVERGGGLRKGVTVEGKPAIGFLDSAHVIAPTPPRVGFRIFFIEKGRPAFLSSVIEEIQYVG